MKSSFKVIAALTGYAILVNASPILERDVKPTTSQPGIVCLGSPNCPISIVPLPTTTTTLHIGGPGPVKLHTTTALPAKRSGIQCGIDGPGGPNCSLSFEPLPTTTTTLHIGGPGPVKPPTTTLHIGGPGPVKPPHTTPSPIVPNHDPQERSVNQCGIDGPGGPICTLSFEPLPTTTTILSIGGPGPVKPHTTTLLVPPNEPGKRSGPHCGQNGPGGPICTEPLPTTTTTHCGQNGPGGPICTEPLPTTTIVVPPNDPGKRSGIQCGVEGPGGPICSLPHRPLPTITAGY